MTTTYLPSETTMPAPREVRRAMATMYAASPRQRTMTRIRQADAQARYDRQRRASARKNGYRGPLTRAELGRYGLAQLADY